MCHALLRLYAQGSQLLPLIGMIGGLLAALLVYAIAYKQRQLLSMEQFYYLELLLMLDLLLRRYY